jgi:S1-C subfamily serine protease
MVGHLKTREGSGMNAFGSILRRLAVISRFVIMGVALALCATLPAGSSSQAVAQDTTAALQSIVKLSIRVPPDARSAKTLGTEREGNGILIDGNGLIVTIGYLVVESDSILVTTAAGKSVPAELVGYDHDSGLGLIRTAVPPGVPPLKLGDSTTTAERDQVLVAAHGGQDAAIGAFVVSRRDFAGSWEYLLENAIFTSPPIAGFGGAALIGRDGRLLGVGSLFIGDAMQGQRPLPGNMFVPIDRLKPILGDLLAQGRPSGPVRPWLGLQPEDVKGRVFVQRVQSDTPAAKAGIGVGDIVLAVGDKPVRDMADYYRKLWALGEAGIPVKLKVLQGADLREVTVQSVDRMTYLKINKTY